MTIPEALKELYVALGGDADDVANMSTNPELIAKIATIAGGGSGLPEVTSADNGDVLTVVEGEWAKANADSASFTIPQDLKVKTKDVKDAINAGKVVKYFYNADGFMIPTHVTVSGTMLSLWFIAFQTVDNSDNVTIGLRIVRGLSDDSYLSLVKEVNKVI